MPTKNRTGRYSHLNIVQNGRLIRAHWAKYPKQRSPMRPPYMHKMAFLNRKIRKFQTVIKTLRFLF